MRALHTVLLTRRRADLGVFVGLVWLAGALVPALMQSYLDLAWWLGHGLEVAGVLLVGLPVATDLFRSSPSRPLAGDLRGAEIVSAEEAFLGSQVGGLVRLLAAKDEYTEGHTRRVALLAVEVGEELGLPPRAREASRTGGCSRHRQALSPRRRGRNSTHVAWKGSAGSLTASRHRVPPLAV